MKITLKKKLGTYLTKINLIKQGIWLVNDKLHDIRDDIITLNEELKL